MYIFFLRFSFIMFVFLSSNAAFAQDKQTVYDSVAHLVQKTFNSDDPSKMYSLTDPTYRERMTAASFSDGTKKFSIKVGRWKDLKFMEQIDGGMAYTAQFERDTQIFFLQLDEQSRIVRFNFKAKPITKRNKNFQVQTDNQLNTAIDILVEKLVRPYIQQEITTGMCIAIIQNGIVRRYSYGEVEKGNKKLPNPETTIFEIGSVTKTFTSLLLAKEVLRNKMNLKDAINKYLPDSIPSLRYKNTAITLQHLANHTSGFPRLPANIFSGVVDPQDPYRHYNEDSLYSFLVRYNPSVMPGSLFSYSNFAAGLLASILARSSHRTFEQLVITQICRPLKMNDTRISLSTKENTRFAKGYNEKGEITAPWNLASLQGSGAIRSTLNDMIVYTRAQLGQTTNPLAKAILLTHKPTFDSKDNTVGLGWRIAKDQTKSYLHHSGGTGGFRSFVGFNKNSQIGVVILSNAAEDVTTIGQDLIENLSGK